MRLSQKIESARGTSCPAALSPLFGASAPRSCWLLLGVLAQSQYCFSSNRNKVYEIFSSSGAITARVLFFWCDSSTSLAAGQHLPPAHFLLPSRLLSVRPQEKHLRQCSPLAASSLRSSSGSLLLVRFYIRLVVIGCAKNLLMMGLDVFPDPK
ncbi:hypothetical protein L2E82_06136 [Cichorium intybus]|uniref:Uncharacterized protein n=1 Tax=Cichorium intybus TaxID=13427 RepID=A0ACB9H9S1_CICIN|nr:hypothetical protein L2E82_06136 [Cichorium intybus]